MQYRCPCGYESDVTPSAGAEIVSVYHVHRASDFRGQSDIVPMEPVEAPASVARERELVGVGSK